MSEGPTRLTVRGGRDQFDWNNVKDDKHYHNYLGHSLKAPVGRWQRNKDLEWFNKTGAGASEDDIRAARVEEIRKIKEAEEEAVAAAMGITLPPREDRRLEITEDASAIEKENPERSDYLDRDKRRSRRDREPRRHRSKSISRSRSRSRHRSSRYEDFRSHRHRRRRSHSRDRSRGRSERHHRSRDDDRARGRDDTERGHRMRRGSRERG